MLCAGDEENPKQPGFFVEPDSPCVRRGCLLNKYKKSRLCKRTTAYIIVPRLVISSLELSDYVGGII